MTLDTPIAQISRFGKLLAKRLSKLELETVRDLIFYYPFRYDDFSNLLAIKDLVPELTATVRGKIELINNRRSPRKRMILTEVLVSDETGSIKVIWFNQPFLAKILKPGDKVYLSGQAKADFYGFHLNNPSYEKVGAGEAIHTARIVPVYSLTSTITQKQIRWLIKSVLPTVKQIQDWLPAEIKKAPRLADLAWSLKQIHFPDGQEKLEKAKERLKFDELFLIQLQAQCLRWNLKHSRAVKIEFKEGETKKFVESLSFKLTDDQRKAAWEILKDLGKSQPMNRLLEGDVGSGKTIVAVMAILNVCLSGYQVAYMAPTEILARQHFETIGRLLNDWPISVGLLTRSDRKIFLNCHSRPVSRYGINSSGNPSSEEIIDSRFRGNDNDASSIIIKKSKILKEIGEGKINVVIGTHALIQEKINFKNLALAIIDEQHRFGVEQRKTLKEKSQNQDYFPHLLSMTATPIPRTLALTLYGDLDLSLIKEMPKGRKKIATTIIAPEARGETYQFIREQIEEGRQAFVICPLIDPSDKLGVKAATEEHQRLSEKIFFDLKIGLIHGRLKAKSKEEVMQGFLENKINILVATSVVEVGIDVPNATMMIIEGAERFGLAQLHQFRGRVGRSEYQSYCFLFTEALYPFLRQAQDKLSSGNIRQRLEALVESENGFDLAEKDLEFRGPGEIYGTHQSGMPELKIAKLTDFEIIKKARDEAQKIMQQDPELTRWPLLRGKIERLEKNVHLE